MSTREGRDTEQRGYQPMGNNGQFGYQPSGNKKGCQPNVAQPQKQPKPPRGSNAQDA